MFVPTYSPRAFRFGPFEVDPETGELRKHGHRVHLQEKPFQLLVALLRQQGRLVTREALRQQLWPVDTFVDFDNGLNTAVSKLREALGDSGEGHRYLETLARRGYRFVGTAEELGLPATDWYKELDVQIPKVTPTTTDRILVPGNRKRRLAIWAFAVITCTAIAYRLRPVTLAFSQTSSFQTINVPGAFSSAAEGVNDQGAVVGNFTPTVESLPLSFLLFQGHFSFFTFPGSEATTTRDINNHSQITGSFLDNGGFEHGFMVLNGNFQQIDVPFPNRGTVGTGINNNKPGDMVGFFRDPKTGLSVSFLRQRNGTFTKFTFPGSVTTEASGINVYSIIVGTYQLGDGVTHGFRVRNGDFQTLDFPGAVDTTPRNINDKNVIVGTYRSPDFVDHGFSLDLTTNTFTTIDRPAATATTINGVNNKDQIAGLSLLSPRNPNRAFQADCTAVF
jgi:DNA-binding winged helix-turn-helix (wHTH) protein